MTFKPRSYLQIGEQLEIIETAENFSKMGLCVVFYKGFGGRLQRALINFLMDFYAKRKYFELFPPVIMEGNPILKMLHGSQLNSNSLPCAYYSYSLCFRKDWAFAEDVKNDLKRLNQFDSIELVKITSPETSYSDLEDTLNETENILNLLELPYETYEFTRGNIDYLASKAYSVKVSLPGIDTHLEISVCSNLTDFFSKDMDICFKDKATGKKIPAHIINATSLIIPRAMMAILENYQQPNGSIAIPKILRPYLHGMEAYEKS